MVAMFRVARNPDPASTLPYLVRVPLPGPPLVLRAKEMWPRTGRIYCHDAGDAWTDALEVVEEVPVRDCRQRGRSIDLVLDRRQLNRSQFVFVTLKGGRPGIFWQSSRTVGGVKPGIRLPTRRAAGQAHLDIVADTRERYGYRFAHQQVEVRKAALSVGDYAVEVDGRVVAAVERKSLDDFAQKVSSGQLAFLMADLGALPRAAVVVEAKYADLFDLEHVQAGWVADQVAHLQVRYPNVSIVFAGSRKFAEEWTFRWLGAARRELGGEDSAPTSTVRDGDIMTLVEEGVWKNRAHGNKRASSTHDTRAEAEAEGKRLADTRGVAHHIDL